MNKKSLAICQLSLSSFIGVSELSAQNEWLIGGNLPTTDAIFGTNSGSLQHLRIHTNGLERMRVLSNGRIGIGTTTPFYSLSVHGVNPEPSIPGGENPPAPGTPSVIQVTNVESGQGQLAGLQMGLTGPNAFIRTLDKVRLQIQNQAANMHLHANGKITLFGQANTAQTPKLTLFSTVNENAFLIDNTGHDHGYSLQIKVNQAAVRAIEVRNGETSNFIVDGNGHVGLGMNQTSVDYLLDAGGKIRACEVRVMNPGWCDYVFAPNYDLMPLEDLKSYIVQNRHLPEVPSESEVEADGFDLAAMNATLLKKIEELTLYVIALNEIVNSLQGNVKN